MLFSIVSFVSFSVICSIFLPPRILKYTTVSSSPTNADEYLAYKVIYNLLLIVLVVDVAFQEFVYKVEQPLPFPVRRERSHRKIITYMFFC